MRRLLRSIMARPLERTLFAVSIMQMIAGIVIVGFHAEPLDLEPRTPEERAALEVGCQATKTVAAKYPLPRGEAQRMRTLLETEPSLNQAQFYPYLREIYHAIARAAEDRRTLDELLALCRRERLPVDDYEPIGASLVVLARGENEGVSWSLGIRAKRDGHCTVFSDTEGGTSSSCDVFGVADRYPIDAHREVVSKRLDDTHFREVHFIIGSVKANVRAVRIRFGDGTTITPTFIEPAAAGRRYFVVHIKIGAPDAVAVALDATGTVIAEIPIQVPPPIPRR